jgi:hypothetical protein
MSVRRPFAAALTLALALALTGCATAADTASTSGATYAEDQGAPPSAARDTGGIDADTEGQKGDASGTVALDRSIVVVAATTVRVDDVAAATDRLGTLIAGAGGRIETQQVTRGGGKSEIPCIDGADCYVPVPGYAGSTTTVRVDPAAVDGLLRGAAALGTVESGSRSSSDVTAEVADVDARVSSAEASLARVRTLLARAETISDVVALESELARRQADLEALQARQRVLADQTAEATVTIALVERDAPLADESATGFVAGLRTGWDAFTSAMVVGLTALGAVLPFAVLAALVALAVWLAVRRTRRQSPAPSA